MKSLGIAPLLFIILTGTSFAQRESITAISGATLIDGTGARPVPGAVVIIRSGRITKIGTSSSVAIPPGARVIHASGKYLVPGLIDTHVHLELAGQSDIADLPAQWATPAQIRNLAELNATLDLRAGFTTVRDLGSSDAVLKVRDEIESGRRVGPRIIAAGMQLVKKSRDFPAEDMFLEYDGPAGGRSQVRYLASIGVDLIKIRLTHVRPVPSLDEVRGIVEEAHRIGLRATVHTDVPADDLVNIAIVAGADGIEHNGPLRSKDTEVLARMARKRMSLMAGAGGFYIQRIDSSGLIDVFDHAQRILLPEGVLTALRSGIDSLHRQTARMKKSGWSAGQRQASFIQEMQGARKAGVLLVFGTDCGAYGMMHGEQYKALYGEHMMGSSAMEAIVMATRDAAKALGRESGLGTIEPGKMADMILLDADPLADLRNLQQVYRVVIGGAVYKPEELSH